MYSHSEKFSKTKWKKDFYVGYSPERTNVGDKSKSLRKVTKLISGDTNQTLKKLKFYIQSLLTIFMRRFYRNS